MANRPIIREASHAGSWYSNSKSELDEQLQDWLGLVVTVPRLQEIERRVIDEAVQNHKPVPEVPASRPPPGMTVFECTDTTSNENPKPTLRLELGEPLQQLPVPGARVIIAPHAGYAYSGPAAAWAYKSWHVSQTQRVFLLGPSHHSYLENAALSRCTEYATPLGNLTVDRETVADLATHQREFGTMDLQTDEDEHSLEMHLPYIYKRLSQAFYSRNERQPNAGELPPIVPIMIGHTTPQMEQDLGRLLAPYLNDPNNAFVISSDFAHWGLRFRYTHYKPSINATARNLRASDTKIPKNAEEFAIHESIKAVDFECMQACESGSHEMWTNVIAETQNTVCGRHPIGVIMAAIEHVRAQEGREDVGAFKFVQYAQSSKVKRVGDSSVSYASAYAVL